MRHLRWILLIAAIAPWAFLALGETPKKTKSGAKKSAQPPDLANLSEPERRAVMLENMAGDQRKKRDEKQKEERAAVLKAAAKLEAALKSAAAEDKPALLYELGVTHLRANNAPQALRCFRQLADSPGEWGERSKIHLFDILLYENHNLTDAGSVVHVVGAAGVGDSPVLSGALVPPLKAPDRPLSPDGVAANLSARSALVDFLNGKPPAFVANGAGNSIWNALANWKPEYPETLEEKSDATWHVRLVELHFVANDHATAISLANAVVSPKGLHPTKSQKSMAYYRRAQATYQLHAAMQPADRGLKDAVADYALAIKTEKDAPWAGEALFLQGNVLWNQFQDDGAAIKLWKELLVQYPKARSAENAAYNIGVLFQLYGNNDKAKAAFGDFRERFPDSKLTASLTAEGLAGHIKPIQRP